MIVCLLIALLFAVVATVEWARLRLAGQIHVAVATAFVAGALDGAAPFATRPRDGIGYLLAVAAVAGVAALFASACGLALGASAVTRR